MRIVVDIPEQAYKTLTSGGVDWLGAEHILSSVANGIVLPKGHGDLIDRDKLQPKLHGVKSIIAGLEAPTVIPADKEVD